MQITADSIGVYTKVFSLSPYQNFDVIRQWSVQWCLMAGPSCLITQSRSTLEETHSTVLIIFVCLLHFGCVLTNSETSVNVVIIWKFENTYPGRQTKPDNGL